MTATADGLLPAPPAGQDPDAVEPVADTDVLTKGCACSASDDHPF